MTYSIEVIISQPMSLQFSHYHMIKMATKNSFYHLFYLLCAIQLPFQQRVLHLRSCMRGTHCDSKVLKSAISRQAKSNKFSLVFWLNEIVGIFFIAYKILYWTFKGIYWLLKGTLNKLFGNNS